MLRNNPSARAAPEDGPEHMGRHMLGLSCTSFGLKAINLLSWGAAPSGPDIKKYGTPVGHMSLFLGAFLIPPALPVVADLDKANDVLGLIKSMLREPKKHW